jgi:hypothetical protein
MCCCSPGYWGCFVRGISLKMRLFPLFFPRSLFCLLLPLVSNTSVYLVFTQPLRFIGGDLFILRPRSLSTTCSSLWIISKAIGTVKKRFCRTPRISLKSKGPNSIFDLTFFANYANIMCCYYTCKPRLLKIFAWMYSLMIRDLIKRI